ncbi:MAG: TIGR04283 family arsenosugar biosynthesis glycosyltransferase [Gemmatimonadota bacterium]|nr:TIGR04283 family arsenosugar biosynthesis glycosyltransferase [Gemmatimonadota bacterium]
MERDTAALGVVIPALDEEEALPPLLQDLAGLAIDHRILVVDGGSWDGTVTAARTGGADVMRSRCGRAQQMNAGAAFLGTRWLLFLHADSRLDETALDSIARHVERDAREAAHFGLAIAHEHFYYRLIESGQRLRERLYGLVYGDQGLLIRRDRFAEVGGYPDEPIMEDVILNRRLRQTGQFVPLAGRLATSSRRYEEEGRIRAWLRNTRTIIRFLSGTDPSVLARGYRPRRMNSPAGLNATPDADPDRTMLLVFAKAPRPGTVKTRLARTVGERRATALYRRMGRLIVANVRPAPARMVVCYDPPDAEAEIRHWLGRPVHRCWPQGSGDLGTRMSRMVERAFFDADRVVVIGTDTPAVDAGTVARAVEALETADVVIGPARDGGYYLMGLRKPDPNLFAGIRWSTDSVLAETRKRTDRLGLSVTWLEMEDDVDTADDLTPEVVRWLDSGKHQTTPHTSLG